MSGQATADLLATIVAATRRSVETRAHEESIEALADRASRRTTRPGCFRDAFGHAARLSVIAECKRRSPSKGVLRADYDPVAIAVAYERAGASAISVLTEPSFFDGSLAHLEAVRAAVSLPLLRKDFIISEYQLLEARASGADAVLLIVSALPPAELRHLHLRALALGLDVLVEVHSEDELRMALDAGATLVGVNNRNLRTLAVDVTLSERVIAQVPREVVAVSESGLRSGGDLIRLRAFGYSAFLIGERFMTERDPGQALSRLLAEASPA
ncbi:MAG: indole-3-glycerol phosphate synthase TrpC [Acidimicrobiia bacterium]|nr:indole-3-glycerol phosphate synthase TrpC [Acidimicrobiia bacterium]